MIKKLLIPSIFLLISAIALASDKGVAFQNAGMPALTRTWIGNDYIQAASVLTSKSTSLPRLSTKEGAALLARICAQDNFDLLKDQSLPLQIRMQDWLSLHNGLMAILKLYIAADTVNFKATDEAAMLMAHSLYSAANGLAVIDQLLLLQPNGKLNPEAQDSLNKMRQNIVGMFVGAEMTLEVQGGFSPKSRSLILDAMVGTMPTFSRTFDKQFARELKRKLELRRQKMESSADRMKVDALLKYLPDVH